MAHLKHAARCVLGFAVAFLATAAAFAADPPQVAAGIAWLSGRVQLDGSVAGESASRGSAFQARVETLTTLRQLASAPTSLADRVSQDSTAAVEVLARKASALAPLGRDMSTAVSALLGRQNADGGFGGASGYQSNALDTAYALRALKAASPSSTAIGPAIDYLKSVQVSSGAFVIAGEASVFATAEAVQALAAFAATQQVAASIASARSWLVSQQVQGSYDDTLKNATAILALLSASNDTAGLPAVVGALAAYQLADGSWEGDPYLTALALRALGAAAELLLPVASTGQVSGTLLADATGMPLAGASISLVGPTTAGGTTDLQGVFGIGNLAAGTYTLQISKVGYATASIAVTVAAGATTRVATIRVQPASTTATLQGTVHDGTNGQPLAGAMVTVNPGSTATTAADGTYLIAGLAPGSVTITIAKSGYDPVTAPVALQANVVYNFSPALYPPGQGPNATSVKGKVVDAANQPVSGATATVGALSATTNAAGEFLLEGLAAGSATLIVAKAGYRDATLTGTLAPGVNDAGTIVLQAVPTTFTLSGRVSDSVTNLPIGGATVVVQSTSFTAQTNSNGNYTIAGVDRTSFALEINAPGYQVKVVTVSLPAAADTVVDAVLVKLPTGAITLRRVTIDPPAYPPYSKIEIEAEVANAGAEPVDVALRVSIRNSAGTTVLEPVTVPHVAKPGAPQEVEIEAHNGSLAAGSYNVVVSVYDGANALLAEGSASFVITALTQVAGDVTVNPPILQAGTNAPVRLTASFSNFGNTVVPAGQAELSITLLNTETPTTSPRIDLLPGITVGDPLFQPLGGGLDAQGNFYTVNQNVLTNPNNRKIVKVAPDGTMTTVKVKVNGQVFDALPAQLSSPGLSVFPIDAVVDPAGNVYILNSTSEIFTVAAADGTLTRRAHGINDGFVLKFDRDSAGNFYIVSGGLSNKIWKLGATGAATALTANSGLNGPQGLVRAPDGNLYVANTAERTISRVAPDGTITPFVWNTMTPPPAIQLSGPQGLTVDPQGNLYVANNGDGRILKITPQAVVSQYAAGMDSPTDLRFDAQGNLFVSASGNVGVYKVGPNGSPVQEWARTLIPGPTAFQYDAAGNMLMTQGSVLWRKNPDDSVTTLSGGFCNAGDIAVGPGGEGYVTGGCNDAIYKVVGTTVTQFITGIAGPIGVTVGNGKIYATQTGGSVHQIVSYDLSQTPPQKVTVAQSLVRTPRAVRVAANGDRYVLNSDSISRIPASGAAGAYVVSPSAFSFGAQGLALAADGGFLVQEANTVRKLDSNGGAQWTKTGLPTLANGVVEAAATALVGDRTAKKIVRVDASGNVTALHTTAFDFAPAAITDDYANGVMVALDSRHLFRVDSSGVVTQLTATTTPLPTLPTRIAFDPAANRIYYVTGANAIGTFDVATKAVGTVPNIATAYGALEVSGGQLLATHNGRRELVSIAPATGQATPIASGFVTPGSMVWTGADLIFSDDTFTLRLVPGANPTIIAAERFNHLAWRAGTLYGTRNDANVYAFTPGTDTASRVHVTPTGSSRLNLQAIAFRADGLLTVGNSFDSAVWSYAPNSTQVVATYAGINTATSIAVSPSGTVYVNSRNTSNVVQIAPSGKQSTVFASSISLNAIAFDSAGTLYGAGGFSAVRFNADGSWTTLASGASGLWGIAPDASGIYIVDQGASFVRKIEGSSFVTFAAGIFSPKGVRVAPTGEVLVASQGNGTVVSYANNKLDMRAFNLNSPQALAFLPTGELVVGGASGHVYVVAADGTAANVGDLPSIYGNNPNTSGSFGIDAMAADANGRLVTVTLARNQVDRIQYTPAGAGPPAGTVIDFHPRASFADIAVAGVSAPMDFGSWTPPYAGDFQITLKPLATQVGGRATNVLHVGPVSTATLAAAPGVVQPGTQTVSVTMDVRGADFTSLARPDPRGISTVVPEMFGSFIGTFGSDSAGRIYATSGFNSAQLLRFPVGGGASQVYYTAPSGSTITNSGALPVDDAQNLYVALGKSVVRVSPAAGGATGVGTKIIDLSENARQLAIASDNTLYALGSTTIYHLQPDTGPDNWKSTALATGTLGSPANFTIDSKDNIYFLGSGGIDIIRKDGSRGNLVGANGAQPSFELAEGFKIAGDCADNLFISPENWSTLVQGQTGEEHTLVHFIGRTGKPSSVFDGSKILPALNDMDAIVFDRFSSSLLVWADTFRGIMYRLPVTCGATDTDLHVVFPATHSAAGFSVVPKAVIPRADGSREYVWSFKDVTTSGKVVRLSATLSGMQYGETRAIASEAYLTFKNTFADDNLKVPVNIPTVRVDGMVDLAMAITGDTTDFAANAIVPGVVKLKNRNVAAAAAGTLLVEITDVQGTRIALVGQQPVSIAADATLDVSAPFNTGTYLTGAYVMRATLTSAGGIELAKGSATFYIVAGGATLAMSVATDRRVYEASDNVSIAGRVRNVSLNSLASGLTLQVKVRNPSGTEIYSGTSSIDLLVPQATKSSVFPLRLVSAAPGVYAVSASLFQGGAQVGSTQEAAFSVLSTADTGTGLAGALTVTRTVQQSESSTIVATAKNLGNATIADLAVSLQVATGGGSALAQWTEPPFALAAGETREITRVWNTTGIAEGTYVASAAATVQLRSIPLGQDSIRVLGDTTPDAFGFAAKTNVPLDTAIDSDGALISGITTAVPISVVGGSYSVNGGAFTTAAGTVAPGGQVRVRVQSAATAGTTTSAALTISGVSATFSVTTTTEDRSPDAFVFASQSNVPLSTQVVSNEVTIAGINVAVPISAIGGELSVNGGAFASAAASVVAGDRVRARIASSASFSTPTTMSVTVGDFTAPFTVTTISADRDPDAFSFASRRNVALNTVIASNTIAVSGINTGVPISVAGGEYRINSGAFKSTADTVVAGDTVTVRLTSAATYATKTTATLTISNVSAAFDVTTIPFELAAQVDVPRATSISSNAATMAGIATTAPISITGGEYNVNGAAFTAAAATVKNGDVVVVRQTSAATFAATTTAALTVGDYTAPFSVTTVPFVLDPQTDVALSTPVTSNTAVMAGIDATAPISIVGGEYKVNAGAFTATAGTVTNGDQVVVRQTSSASPLTKTTATLTVGHYSAPFDVTTFAADATPDAFAFTPQTGVARNTVVTSNTITVSGINTAVTISVANGEYRINSGAWVTASGLVVNGDQVAVRLTSSNAFSTTTLATLAISGVSAQFSVTTVAEDTVPDAFAFAPRRNVAFSTAIVSNEIVVAGINTTVPVAIAGGEYSVNGAAFTTAAGSVVAGDRVRVRVTSGAAYATTTTATLTISTVTGAFDVTTVPFELAPRVNVLPSTQASSAAVTMAGITGTAAISIAGGEYNVNGGAFMAAAATVKNGDVVVVRLTSAATFATKSTAALTVGDYTAPFDVTTVPFLLPEQLDVPLATPILSDPAVMAGIAATAQISITGGDYQVNGGAFTTATGTVRNGDVVIVRQTSSASFSTRTTATLIVGDYNAAFDVKTLAEDRIPEPFSFAPQVNVPVASVRTSESITIVGINTGVPIGVSNGQYSVNGAAFTAAAGVVHNGDIVTLRQTSSSAFATTTSAVLTVSAVSASFDVTTIATAQVNIALTYNADTRLLVLVSCRRSDEVDGSTDDSDDATCLAARRTFLDNYLTSLGITHTIVDSNDAFKLGLRSGKYNTYWITGGQDKFHDGLDHELIEAVVRGEALLVDGTHDERNKSLDPVLGVKYLGKPTGLTTVTLAGSFLPSGTFNVAGHRAIRVDLAGGETQATFNTGAPALVANSWGYGKALLFAFDLTGTLQAQAATALLTPMFEASLDFVAAVAPASYTGGAFVPLMVQIHNTESVPVDVSVTSTVPAGFQVAAGVPPATLSGTTLTWTATLAASSSATFEWALRAPAAAGTYSVPIEVRQVNGGSSVSLGTRTITIVVDGLATSMSQTITALQALALASSKDDKARDDAVARLQEAQALIAASSWESATGKLLDAAAALDGVQGVSVAVHAAAIARFIQDVEQRWYQALPPCPATPACR